MKRWPPRQQVEQDFRRIIVDVNNGEGEESRGYKAWRAKNAASRRTIGCCGRNVDCGVQTAIGQQAL
jgi:hypothetical protein